MKHALLLLIACTSAAFANDTLRLSSTLAIFTNATAISIDPSGFIFVADQGTNEVVKLNRAGIVLARAGGNGSTRTSFGNPVDVTAPNGLDVYVADYSNHRVVRFDKDLNFVSEYPDSRGDSPAEEVFGYPSGIGVDRFGALFISDRANSRMVKLDARRSVERTFGGIEAGKGRLKSPSGIGIAGDFVHVMDESRLLVYDLFGNFIRRDNAIGNARAVCVRMDSVFVLDSAVVRVLNSKGLLLGSFFLDSGTKAPSVDEAVDIEYEGSGLYVLCRRTILIFKRSTTTTH